MNIYGLTYAQLENYLTSIGEKKSKAPFIFQSLYRTQVTSLMDVSEINQRLKTQLADTFTVTLPQLVDKTDGTDTVKFLFALQGDTKTQRILNRSGTYETKLWQ